MLKYDFTIKKNSNNNANALLREEQLNDSPGRLYFGSCCALMVNIKNDCINSIMIMRDLFEKKWSRSVEGS